MSEIRTILVIEDDEKVRTVTERMLESLGYRPVGAETVADARAVLSRETVDLVLTDIILADEISGPEFAKEIRGRSPEMPIVFMSGYPAAAAKWLAEFGTDIPLLNKPFRVQQLEQAVREVLV